MESLNISLKEYIESGKYYKDSREWYKYKYIHPFSERSCLILFVFIICVLLIGVIININNQFPSVVPVQYSINADSSDNKTAKIIKANQIDNDPLASILDIMIKNYVIKRESYNYYDLRKQFIFVKNNSTRIVFRRFYNFMNIDNPSSPVMKYQKFLHRVPRIISISYKNMSTAIVKFESVINDSAGKNLEKMVQQATIEYEIDKIDPDLPNDTRFNFTVTNYQLKLLEDTKSK